MFSYSICWLGRLNDHEKQLEFLSFFNRLALLYTDRYYGKLNDDTTYHYFNEETIKGKIIVSKALLNLPDYCTTEDIVPLYTYPDDSSQRYFCEQIKLLGVQFKFKANVMTTIEQRQLQETIAFVFWGFDSTSKPNPLIKSNIAELNIVKSIRSGGDIRYELIPSSVNFEHFKPYICNNLLDFAAHYFFDKLEWEDTNDFYNQGISIVKRFLIDKDPQANKEDVKAEAFKMLEGYFLDWALLSKKMDESEIKSRAGDQEFYEDE